MEPQGIPGDATLMAEPAGTKTGPMAIQLKQNWQAPFVGGLIRRMEKVGDEMVKEAQEIAPNVTGTLAGSIYRLVVQPRGSNGRFGDAVLIFGASVDYALPVEFGHHTSSGSFVEAQPFLRPVALKKRNIG